MRTSNLNRRSLAVAMGMGFGLLATGMSAHAAESGKLRIAQQFGIPYLLLDVARDQKLIEKHGKLLGQDIAVEWKQLSGGPAMNEALLAGSLDVVSGGLPPMLSLWDRTKGRQNVKAIASLGSLPMYLVSNNPKVKTINDLSKDDRIAVPAAGVSVQARTLQIGSAKLFGDKEFKRFDNITVSLPHPEATAALIAGKSEINTHFASAPFYYQSLAGNPAVHKVASSFEIMGGPVTMNVAYTSEKFQKANPKTVKAFHNALAEAAQLIKADKAKAAEIFIRVQQSKLAPELVQQIVADPENNFTVTPERTMAYASELHKLGALKHKATDWKDYFFADAAAGKGS